MIALEAQSIVHRLLIASPAVRYVALYQSGELFSELRPGVQDTSSGETDRYEELFVNPTLLLLTKQRGEIDCGGLQFLIVRYGNFYQLIRPYKDGHLSICIGLEADPIEQEALIRSVV